MNRMFMGAVFLSLLGSTVSAAAAECGRTSLRGDWFLASGGQLVCEVRVSARGDADGACRFASADGDDGAFVPFKGQFSMNRRCEIAIVIEDVNFRGEARGWATQRADRIDMMGGLLGWKVEEGVSTSWKVEEGEAIIGFMANRRNN